MGVVSSEGNVPVRLIIYISINKKTASYMAIWLERNRAEASCKHHEMLTKVRE